MKISLPILVYKRESYFTARPLLFDDVSTIHTNQGQAVSMLETELENYLNQLMADGDWATFQSRVRTPDVRSAPTKLRIDVTDLFLTTTILFIHWNNRGVNFLYAPFLKDFFFAVPPDADLFEYSEQMTREWIRSQKEEYSMEEICQTLVTWDMDNLKKVQLLNISLTTADCLAVFSSQPSEDTRAALLNEGRRDLRDIGRNYRWNAEEETKARQPKKIRLFEERLAAFLTGPKRKSAILLGDSFSGRTRLIESVLKRIDRDRNFVEAEGEWQCRVNAGPTVGWTLTPGGMISGMSVTGQWEHRCKAIFEFAAEKNLILRFAPFSGFLEAGQTPLGHVSIADFIQIELSQNRFRAVAELTPDELKMMRERNRTLISQFEIFEMPELSEAEEREIAIRALQSVSRTMRTRGDMSFLPTLIQLTDYFESEKAAPGRFCRWFDDLERLGGDFWDFYEKKRGVDTSFFRSDRINSDADDSEKKTSRERILSSFSSGLVGQHAALETLTDLVLRTRTHLNDLSRTLGAYLFVGPTGVGKTEAAKQLARVLFGGEEGLIRFDTNELTTPWSVAALIGNGQREGTLTSAVRLRPNCVLLFDEIEKAHPDLADLLLQVLGEGRLTDGAGRVVSFAQCVVIFTSNLGVRDAEHFVGFDVPERQENANYLRAVQDYFRPEWINRLDGIIPFTRLRREDSVEITKRMIDSIKNREGFYKRRTLLRIPPAAESLLIDRIGDTRWGARGVIRMLEKELIVPVSEYLAAVPPDKPSVVEVYVQTGRLKCQPAAFKAHPPMNELFQTFGRENDNPALCRVVAEEGIRFIKDCQRRQSEFFPEYGSEEKHSLRISFMMYSQWCLASLFGNSYPTLNDSLFPATDENDIHNKEYNSLSGGESNLKRRGMGKRLEKMIDRGESIHDPEDACGYQRVRLSSGEWNQVLKTLYEQTVDEIADPREERGSAPLPIWATLEELMPFFLLFGPKKPQNEGVVLFYFPFHKDADIIYQRETFDNYFSGLEIKQGNTKDDCQWLSVVGDDARNWATKNIYSHLEYKTDNTFYSWLHSPRFFDPAAESIESVVEQWESEDYHTWMPFDDCDISSIPSQYLYSDLPERIPESFLANIRRYLDERKG